MRYLLAVILVLGFSNAYAQTISPTPSGFQRLYATGTAVGNGADTSADTLQSFTLSAGQLNNAGDVIHIRAAGTYAATTDQKVIHLKIGGQDVATFNTASASSLNWSVDAVLMKTGSNAQSYESTSIMQASGFLKSGTLTLTDTGTLQILLTGQDQTSATANAIVAQMLTVDYEH